ncbi:MAG TPA: methyltransferase domain-containing protein [Sphingomonas sp.]|uniref:SAM-dependent methyltransferase n=1 Tax=Sphingomonas sp. TaxID=28214 RepID=UPI002C89A48A|nr:methyltransferase domain-containing protein [Sphingomonas sp.]HMI18354.1 methyltransferase domain-containing protein [Sphingomonas sp.]
MLTQWLRRRRERRTGFPGARINNRDLTALLTPVGAQGHPNLNRLRLIANAIDPLALNIKQMGYSLARQLADALPPPTGTVARKHNLPSGLSTQAAMESEWVAHWCGELKIPVTYHRKLWELCFVLQFLFEADMIAPGKRGLGFGCGEEPLPSYLAAHGVSVTATDIPPEEAVSSGWRESGQHATARDLAFMEHLVGRQAFDENVDLRFVDMNRIPADLTGYDFCWSICALEHLGSIRNGLAFVENAMACLRPGGVAVHTTEFNIREDGPTVDNWMSVAFQRKHMEELAQKLRSQGHHVAPFDFDLGGGPLDRFVDMPPYHGELPASFAEWLGPPAHLKASMDGMIVTCIGIAIRKAS